MATVKVKTYNVGSGIRIEGTFEDSATGVKIDPTDVIIDLLEPDGTRFQKKLSLAEVIRSELGVFHYDYLAVKEGHHEYSITGTGNVDVVKEFRFKIRHSRVLEATLI